MLGLAVAVVTIATASAVPSSYLERALAQLDDGPAPSEAQPAPPGNDGPPAPHGGLGPHPNLSPKKVMGFLLLLNAIVHGPGGVCHCEGPAPPHELSPLKLMRVAMLLKALNLGPGAISFTGTF